MGFGNNQKVVSAPFGRDGSKVLAHIDSWGDGPFTIKVRGRRYYFSDSDMFGPLMEGRDGRVLDRQPMERHPFWPAYTMWRKLGRRGQKVGRWTVCRWRVPRPGQYWKDDKGLAHIICDPEFDVLGYRRVEEPKGSS